MPLFPPVCEVCCSITYQFTCSYLSEEFMLLKQAGVLFPVEFFLYANDTLWRSSELHLAKKAKTCLCTEVHISYFH